MERWIGDFPTRCRYNEYLAATFGYLCFCFDCVNRSRVERGLSPMSRGPLKYMKTPPYEIGIWDWTGGYAELESPFNPNPRWPR